MKSVKQVIVIRRDLKMRRGKEIAQGAHASLKAALIAQHTKDFKTWVDSEGARKITVQVQAEQDLIDLANKAKSLGLVHALIRDSGTTEFGGVPTLTALAIGPADSDKIDQVTGSCALY